MIWGCGNGQVVVTLSDSDNDCLCVEDVCETLCCPCPEWDITPTVSGNTICFNIDESNGYPIDPDCVYFYTDGEFESIAFNEPWCFTLTDATQEVCIVIYSDDIPGNGCDSLGTTITPPLRKGPSSDVCISTCTYEWCMPWNSPRIDDTNITIAQDENQHRMSSENIDALFESLVYPNPHTGTTNLEINTTEDAKFELVLYGIFGNSIWSEKIDSKNGSIYRSLDMQDYESGVYLLVIKWRRLLSNASNSFVTLSGRLVIN